MGGGFPATYETHDARAKSGCRYEKRRGPWPRSQPKTTGLQGVKCACGKQCVNGTNGLATFAGATPVPRHARPRHGPPTKAFVDQALRCMGPAAFSKRCASRTVEAAPLKESNVVSAVRIGKFGPCSGESLVNEPTSHIGIHGVNAFVVPRLKGRRRLVTEPHLNATSSDHEMPRVAYPNGFAVGSLRRATRSVL